MYFILVTLAGKKKRLEYKKGRLKEDEQRREIKEKLEKRELHVLREAVLSSREWAASQKKSLKRD